MKISEKELLKKLEVSDLQEQHREFAIAIGMDNLIKLSEYFGGSSIYVPQKRELIKLKVFAMIREEYNGTNIKELANKYDVSESTVYNVLRDMLLKGAAKRRVKESIPGQVDFMEWYKEL